MKTLTEEALTGTVTWTRTSRGRSPRASRPSTPSMSTQLAAVMHNPEFQKLEGTWRGLHYLVMNSETGTS